ncbi:hypothetical protein OUZ56_021379 [Daphnia magna]|uniref:Secreted protein n=1 Tax=Daphnia magna TaxID=35525 RepID=A0ABQ9ZHV7_9CRUS|nr:hypothetical protein OUZ56_021379 [Daphnia magna]
MCSSLCVSICERKCCQQPLAPFWACVEWQTMAAAILLDESQREPTSQAKALLVVALASRILASSCSDRRISVSRPIDRPSLFIESNTDGGCTVLVGGRREKSEKTKKKCKIEQ